MTNAGLVNFMNHKGALVVHFSHHANMRDGGVFPDDLINAFLVHCLSMDCLKQNSPHPNLGGVYLVRHPHEPLPFVISVAHRLSMSDRNYISDGRLHSFICHPRRETLGNKKPAFAGSCADFLASPADEPAW